MRRIIQLALLLALAAPAFASQNWFIRPDGGTRHSANITYGECTGLADAAYPGTTQNTWGGGLTLALNYTIVDSSGNYEKVTTAGTTTTSAFSPTWPSHGSSGATTTDNTVTWTSQGAAPYNQACAFNDFRYLYDDNGAEYPYTGTWLIAGGDTVVVRGCHALSTQVNPSNPNCRVGWDATVQGGGDPGNTWCWAAGAASCFGGTIPAGTSGAHTRILGGCAYDSTPGPCNSGNTTNLGNLTQIFGGFGVEFVLNLTNTQYVDVEGLEFTDHSNCILYGNAGLPSVCSSSGSTDSANSGIATSNTNSNVLLQDLNIHGLPASGIYGSVGPSITLNRIAVSNNGFAGWNFDNKTANGVGASITAHYVTMIGNGCNEEYPIVDPYPWTYCYSQSSGGFGDAWSGQDAALTFTGDHLWIQYNIKDAFFGPHTAINATVKDSTAIGNGGQIWKYNGGYSGVEDFENNLTISNCARMSQAITGAPSTFNTYLEDYCRADGAAFADIWPITGSVKIVGNTFAAQSANSGFDFACWNQMDGYSVGAAGTGYTVGQVLTLGGSGAVFQVATVNGSGGVLTGTLTTLGQWPGAPYTVYDYINYSSSIYAYIGGGNGSGLTIALTSSTTASCGGGPRILQDNLFLGITDPLTGDWNEELIGFFCYSSCNGSSGNSNDTQWTLRNYNLMYAFKTGTYACSYATEVCTSPLLVAQPPTTVVTEAAYDVFNPSVGGNSFGITVSSPANGGGVAVSGLTTDFYGTTRPSPPSMGGVEYGSGPVTTFPLTVSITGNGASYGGLAGAGSANCTTGTYTAGTEITCVPTATVGSGWVFTGWGGACSGMGTCQFPLSSALAVTANFVLTVAQDLSLELQTPASTVNTSAPGWNINNIPGDTGGVNTPASATQTGGQTSPAGGCTGTSLLNSMTTIATSTQTNALYWYWGAGADTATNFIAEACIYVGNIAGANNIELDFDQYNYTLGKLISNGHQYHIASGCWQYANNSSGWQATSACPTFTGNAWHHLFFTGHRDALNVYYDTITQDGVTYTLNTSLANEALPGGYPTALIDQFQIDAGPTTGTAATVTYNVESMDFSAYIPGSGSTGSAPQLLLGMP